MSHCPECAEKEKRIRSLELALYEAASKPSREARVVRNELLMALRRQASRSHIAAVSERWLAAYEHELLAGDFGAIEP